MFGVKSGNRYVVVGYHVDDFTHTWSVDHYTTQSHIYPGFMGKLPTTYFPLKQGCEDYSFLNQAVEDFKHGLDSILMNSINTTELNASLYEVDTIPSSVSSGYLCLINCF